MCGERVGGACFLFLTLGPLREPVWGRGHSLSTAWGPIWPLKLLWKPLGASQARSAPSHQAPGMRISVASEPLGAAQIKPEARVVLCSDLAGFPGASCAGQELVRRMRLDIRQV